MQCKDHEGQNYSRRFCPWSLSANDSQCQNQKHNAYRHDAHKCDAKTKTTSHKNTMHINMMHKMWCKTKTTSPKNTMPINVMQKQRPLFPKTQCTQMWCKDRDHLSQNIMLKPQTDKLKTLEIWDRFSPKTQSYINHKSQIDKLKTLKIQDCFKDCQKLQRHWHSNDEKNHNNKKKYEEVWSLFKKRHKN
jgi:hypothetical protein